MSRTVAALYVASRGCYYGLDDVEPWGLPERDAREYAGPHPVVAHPPCARWGRYALGGPSHYGRFKVGDDGGCFAAALASVRRWGGGTGAPRRIVGMGRFRAARAGTEWRMVARYVRRMVLPRRAGALRSPGAQGDVAVRLWVRSAAAGLGSVVCDRKARRRVPFCLGAPGSKSPRRARHERHYLPPRAPCDAARVS